VAGDTQPVGVRGVELECAARLDAEDVSVGAGADVQQQGDALVVGLVDDGGAAVAWRKPKGAPE